MIEILLLCIPLGLITWRAAIHGQIYIEFKPAKPYPYSVWRRSFSGYDDCLSAHETGDGAREAAEFAAKNPPRRTTIR